MNKQINAKFALGILIILASVVAGYTIRECKFFYIPIPQIICCKTPHQHFSASEIEGIERFGSEEDFKNYLREAELSSYGLGIGGGFGRGGVVSEEGMAPVAAPLDTGEKSAEPERISDTNVQVEGIDEPDIVKTDGQEIYFSSTQNYYWKWSWGTFPETAGETKTIKAFPPASLAIDAKIDKTGNLLLSGKNLIIFSNDRIYGYDVSDPKSPKKEWTIEVESKSSVADARLYNGKVYLITQTMIDTFHPCPVSPLSVEGDAFEVGCVDIYHPIVPVQTDITYNAMIVNPDTGNIEKSVSFVGSSGQSVIYMSKEGVYITYSYTGDYIKFYFNFFNEKCKDIIPSWLIEKTEKLASYDISESAKITELQVLFQKYYTSLSDDERLKIENELTNRMSDYYKEQRRELEKTGIVKIGLDQLEVVASGNVPGQPLNQFSLDEYNGHLRIAVTVGERFFGIGFIGITRQSANDVYVLNKDLVITGSVKDLGLEERIYSARFVEDKGYLVTFRQVDPFYVLDLSDPENPELKGELKIPGYSSYLHPIAKDRILGIGKEDSQVKVSLFNVESPAKPSELDKYVLNEYWSDILNTHHAFLLDTKHQIFFLPGSQGGYIFSYKGDKLGLVKAVSNIQAKRAIYLDDYLYIIGEDEIVVLDELNWKEINGLEF